VREGARHLLRIQKVLEDANVQLREVVRDLRGARARAMRNALVAGEPDPVRLAACTTGHLRATPAALQAALQGRVTDHHRYLLQLHLASMHWTRRSAPSNRELGRPWACSARRSSA